MIFGLFLSNSCVFSILFQKKFIVNTATRKGMSGRIVDLLNIVGLQDRKLDSDSIADAIKLYKKECDFKKSEEAMQSAKWLIEAIKN